MDHHKGQTGEVQKPSPDYYYALGTDLLFPGWGITGTFEQRGTHDPDEILYQLPMTLGTSWTTTYVESTIVSQPPPVSIIHQTVDNTVDAYGALTLPGGGVYQALRLRTDRRSTSNAYSARTIYYTILARNGANVGIFAADTLQSNSGTINVSSISWTGPVVTGVQLSDAVPTRYTLMQNYPNPFNPATVVSFQLPTASDVRLVVYDILGREVANLVNERKEPGTYAVQFDATGLASGAYFYRLTAGGWTNTRKMMVMK